VSPAVGNAIDDAIGVRIASCPSRGAGGAGALSIEDKGAPPSSRELRRDKKEDGMKRAHSAARF
jgi:hypothetical protein